MAKKEVAVTEILYPIETVIPAVNISGVDAWKPYKSIKSEAFENAMKLHRAGCASDPDYESTYRAPTADLFGIEDARVRRHFNWLGLNLKTSEYASTIAAKYNELNADMSGDDKEKYHAVIRARVRIGSTVAEYTRYFCEEIVNDLAHIAIESTLRNGQKMVHADRAYGCDIGYLNLAKFRRLFDNTPAFCEARAEAEFTRIRVEGARCASSYLARFSHYLSAKGSERYKSTRKYLDEYASSSRSATEDSAEGSRVGTNFMFYIRRMLSVIRDSDPRYAGIRFGHDFIPFIDKVLVDFVYTVAMRALIIITDTNTETISSKTIHSVVIGMLTPPQAIYERDITSFEMVNVKRATVAKDGGKRGSENRDELFAVIAKPSIVREIDELYPAPQRQTADQSVDEVVDRDDDAGDADSAQKLKRAPKKILQQIAKKISPDADDAPSDKTAPAASISEEEAAVASDEDVDEVVVEKPVVAVEKPIVVAEKPVKTPRAKKAPSEKKREPAKSKAR